MKPNGLEALRAIQATLVETLMPELQSMFAQDSAQTIAMLVESLAAEWDAAAADLHTDNEAIRGVLAAAASALLALPGRNENRDALVIDVDGVMREAGDGSGAVSSLSAENDRLRLVLEHLLSFIEDTSGELDSEGLDETRRAAYRHLRQVATRGWCFWDVASFRERMVQARAETQT
ncbi:MAG: hypothetical protein WD904_14240 [Dehalococcoidia bacterium]